MRTILNILTLVIAMLQAGCRRPSEGAPQMLGTTPTTVAESIRRVLCPTQRPDSFKVKHVDTNASVSIDERMGYLIIISKQVPMCLPEANPSPTRSPPSMDVTEYSEIILFPVDQILPNDLTNRLPWVGFTSIYNVQAVDMGTGLGYHWFGRMNLWEQDDIRERLHLNGGDNRQELANHGLSVKDRGRMTANSMACRMDRFKPRNVSNDTPEGIRPPADVLTKP